MAVVYAYSWEQDIGNVYIGKTINKPSKRFRDHIKDMEDGVHHSYKVQSQYDKYGPPTVFTILAECTGIEVHLLEIDYIKEFDSVKHGLNVSEEYGAGKIGTSKYSKIQVLKVFSMLCSGKYSYIDISTRTKVSVGSIKSIRQGTNHGWLSSEYPEKWTCLNNRPHTIVAKTVSKNAITLISPEGQVFENITNLREFIMNNDFFKNKDSAYKTISSINKHTSSSKSYMGWKKLNN